MTTFDQAQKIAQTWPADKGAPGMLRELYDRTPAGDRSEVGMFLEALMAAASDGTDLALINASWEDVEEE
jgi:hypothetical protein